MPDTGIHAGLVIIFFSDIDLAALATRALTLFINYFRHDVN